MIDRASILREIGYNLEDRGTYWQTSAIFRDGDNKTALRIYKDSGVWSDFVEGNKPLPFEILLKKTLNTNDVSKYLSGSASFTTNNKKEFLKEEKTFPNSSLQKLLPDYSFYTKRGISVDVLKEYKSGLASSGKFYQRVVFPIHREDGRIHGFSGRLGYEAPEDDARPKWLHYGKSADWFYPFFSLEGVADQIIKDDSIFVIESIGDSLAMTQEGMRNHMVAFTNVLNTRQVSRLATLNTNIILAFNNDEGQNRGFDGALSSCLKLMDQVDLEKIWFYPPPAEDFGEIIKNGGNLTEYKENLNLNSDFHKDCIKRLIDYAPNAKIPKVLRAKVPKLKEQWNFLYQ